MAPPRFLHLEDDPRDAEIIRETLISGGVACAIDLVSSPAAFRAAFEPTPPDLVLSDFSLPGFDGFSALEFVRGRAPDLPFVVVSGALGEEAAVDMVRGGATDYVLKHRLSRLVPAVKRALAEAEERRRRREVEESLRRERSFLKALLESLDAGIVACDSQGLLTLFNRAGREMHGLSEEPLPPEEWAARYDLYEQDGKTLLRKESVPLYRALQGERVRNAEIVIRPKSRPPVTVLASGQPITDESGRQLGAVVAMTDITESKRLTDQLRQAQKMEAVGRLAGGIAHDFNNLLGVISGYSEILMGRLPEGGDAREKILQIRKAADRAASLTRQLLAFSRKQVREVRVLDLNTLLSDMDRMLRRLIGEDIELATRLAPDLGRVEADPGQIEQIVMNLVVNSRDAMPEGGRLEMETANAEIDEAFAGRHAGARPGRYVMLAVTDTGVGMEEEVRSQVFEPFFTTKEQGKGTGLGLATVYGIVKQSDGYVSVESEPGRGSCFRIYLPRVERPADKARQAEVAASPRGEETILLVEDEATLRNLLVEALRGLGYTVLAVSNTREALDIGQTHPGAIHVLITDVVMPEMNGPEVAQRLSSRRPGMKVIYMSGYAEGVLAPHGVLEKGLELIQKPFTLGAVARKVRQVLDGQGGGAV